MHSCFKILQCSHKCSRYKFILETGQKYQNVMNKHEAAQFLMEMAEITSPDIRTQLTTCWGHPSLRMIHTFSNFPTRHILHHFCLILEIFMPLSNKSREGNKQNNGNVKWCQHNNTCLCDDTKLVKAFQIPLILFGLQHRQYGSAGSIFFFLQCPIGNETLYINFTLSGNWSGSSLNGYFYFSVPHPTNPQNQS